LKRCNTKIKANEKNITFRDAFKKTFHLYGFPSRKSGKSLSRLPANITKQINEMAVLHLRHNSGGMNCGIFLYHHPPGPVFPPHFSSSLLATVALGY